MLFKNKNNKYCVDDSLYVIAYPNTIWSSNITSIVKQVVVIVNLSHLYFRVMLLLPTFRNCVWVFFSISKQMPITSIVKFGTCKEDKEGRRKR
jgi:hypothetical protein